MENRRSKMTKQLFHESFYELLQEMPKERITVKALCERADLNRSTFYLHYETLDDLICELEQAWIDEHFQNLGYVGEDDVTTAFILRLLTRMKANRTLFRRLLDDPHFVALYARSMRSYFLQTIRSPASPAESDYANVFVLYGGLAVAKMWLDAGCDVPEDRLAEMIFRMSHGATYPAS